MKAIYKWQGEPVKVEFGHSKVYEVVEKPMWWYNFECCWNTHKDQPRYNSGRKLALIPCVRVTAGSHTFVISNHYGIGVHKLLAGGWPSHVHFSLPNDSFRENTKTDKLWADIREFDLDGYTGHENNRRKWQRSAHPIEFEAHETFLQSFKNPTP